MNNFEIELLNNGIILLVPIDAEVPLSTIIETFNKSNKLDSGMIIIDLLIYVGNRKKRFKICRLIDGKIEMNMLESYIPTNEIVEKAYSLFSKAPEGLINRIIIPSIRKRILDIKNSV